MSVLNRLSANQDTYPNERKQEDQLPKEPQQEIVPIPSEILSLHKSIEVNLQLTPAVVMGRAWTGNYDADAFIFAGLTPEGIDNRWISREHCAFYVGENSPEIVVLGPNGIDVLFCRRENFYHPVEVVDRDFFKAGSAIPVFDGMVLELAPSGITDEVIEKYEELIKELAILQKRAATDINSFTVKDHERYQQLHDMLIMKKFIFPTRILFSQCANNPYSWHLTQIKTVNDEIIPKDMWIRQ